MQQQAGVERWLKGACLPHEYLALVLGFRIRRYSYIRI